ncbi:MAG: UbiA-like polyprenyltransferase [Planctomycetota bacterium]
MGRTATFLGLIRFEHTLFALPYAVAGAFLAAEGWPPAWTFLWILVAMVGARTAAMTFNRLVDRRFDATNPRTAGRASVTGAVSPGYMVVATLISVALFFLAAWMLRVEGKAPWAFWLAGPTLLVLLGYSLTKRFFSGAHYVLGIALGLSPLGAWVAVQGSPAGAWPALWLGAAVLFWTAGFDILYAFQDVEHDRREGLHSVPARMGRTGALLLARLSHALVPIALYLTGRSAGLGWIYQTAVVLVAALLVVEHALLRGGRFDRIAQAFFHVNVVIAFVVMLGTILDLLIHGGAP